MSKCKVLLEPHGPIGRHWSPFPYPSARHQVILRDHGYRASASCGVPVYAPAFTPVPIYTAWWQRHTGVNNLHKVTRQHHSQESSSQPLSCKSNALTTRLPSH